jgi:hypothetical protein
MNPPGNSFARATQPMHRTRAATNSLSSGGLFHYLSASTSLVCPGCLHTRPSVCSFEDARYQHRGERRWSSHLYLHHTTLRRSSNRRQAASRMGASCCALPAGRAHDRPHLGQSGASTPAPQGGPPTNVQKAPRPPSQWIDWARLWPVMHTCPPARFACLLPWREAGIQDQDQDQGQDPGTLTLPYCLPTNGTATSYGLPAVIGALVQGPDDNRI